ncbi:MAG: LLM class flavin-dependent oxidoreductase [Chloroflexota bacterium]|nr:LLM class flavin-dependent oxidoreductase [Chloroflexota bacterium]
MIPIGLNPTTIGVSSAWWRETAIAAEQAGFKGVWSWDHFVSRGKKTDPVLECWTTLTAAAAVTSTLKVGSFINNVMNRNPAVLARMLATLCDQALGRVELGIGVGGSGPELTSYGIDLPEPGVRVRILEEAVAVIRLLLAGGPADYQGEFFSLHEAYAFPTPQPAPRIIVGGEKPGGARLAARVGDGWTTNGTDYEQLLPVHLEELARVGRSRSDVVHLIAVDLARDVELAEQPLIADMATFLGKWHDRGADEVVVSWVRVHERDALLDAAVRAGLAGSR